MTKVVLIRHGRSTANADGVLAGRAPGVALDEVGRAQAVALRDVFDGVAIATAYTTPIQRSRETAELAGFPGAAVLDGVSECHYGDWTGAKLSDLADTDLWRDIQTTPSSVSVPGGESMHDMFERTVAAIREVAGRHGDGDTVVVFSHGDPIKAILADALGMARDDFQRVNVSPAGVSIVDYRGDRPLVVCVNGGTDLRGLLGASVAPVVGGGAVAAGG